jgi:hypothetical protein
MSRNENSSRNPPASLSPSLLLDSPRKERDAMEKSLFDLLDELERMSLVRERQVSKKDFERRSRNYFQAASILRDAFPLDRMITFDETLAYIKGRIMRKRIQEFFESGAISDRELSSDSENEIENAYDYL